MAILIEVLVFLLPLLYFHRVMVAQKKMHLQGADELSQEISLAEHQLTNEQDSRKRELLKDRLSSMTKGYWDIKNLPTWPVAKKQSCI